MRGLCVGFTGGQFAPPLPRRGKPGALRLPRTPSGPPILPLRTPHRQTAAPGFAVPASAARPHSAAFGGARGFSSYPVECAFRLPVRSRSSGAGERGAGGSEASPAHRRPYSEPGVRAFGKANKLTVTPECFEKTFRCGESEASPARLNTSIKNRAGNASYPALFSSLVSGGLAFGEETAQQRAQRAIEHQRRGKIAEAVRQIKRNA